MSKTFPTLCTSLPTRRTSQDKSCLLTVDGLSILRKDFIRATYPPTIEVAEVVKGAGLKIRSQMGSRVQIPPSIPFPSVWNHSCLNISCKTV